MPGAPAPQPPVNRWNRRSLTAAVRLVVAMPLLLCCDGARPSLFINLRTDLVPGLEFEIVEVAVDDAPSIQVPVRTDASYIDGVRVAALIELDPSHNRRVGVALLDTAGERVIGGETVSSNVATRTVTLDLWRSCVDVECPTGRDGEPQQCFGGTCQSARCQTAQTDDCVAECESDPECPAMHSCARPRCLDRVCVYVDRGICDTGETCVPDEGCRALGTFDGDAGPAEVDAAVPDGGVASDGGATGAPELCNGIDDDLDGDTDEALTQPCSSACGSGVETCTGGSFGACSAPQPTTETCNGADDDCDGTVDGMTRACSSACGAGTETCVDGAYVNCSAPPVPAEVCDLADNDCDGVCDNASAGCRIGVHRYRHPGTGEHFYVTNPSDATCCGFVLQQANYFRLYRNAAPGLVALNRCIQSSGFHFLTTHANCENAPGATNEGRLGYIGSGVACGSTVLHRLRIGNGHLYTHSTSERDAVVASGGIYEGPTGHAWLAP